MAFSLLEALLPLRKRTEWNKRHLGPNLSLTLITFATNTAYNIPILLGLVWLQANGLGLFNMTNLPPIVEIAGAILALDLAWYVTHRSMHAIPALWPIHTIHHSDLAVDATTGVRQHPGEGLLRYMFLAAFAFSFGVSPFAFAIYRIWSAAHGMFEHANIRLPQWLDNAITVVFSSPSMHKIHHSRDQRFTDTNYGNIFSIWDRAFGTFTPPRYGHDINYGLDGYDDPAQQTTVGLLMEPFRSRSAALAEDVR
jgi:sterol desaturase/sphingolipid hydroxylase (fatty acid hydroxylase superfamily)